MAEMNITLKVPAIRSRQYGTTTYVFNLNYEECDRIIHLRSPETYDQITETNRPITKKHAESIKEFILNTEDSPLQTLTLYGAEELIEFEDGIATIKSSLDGLGIIDGQHRRLAMRNAIHEAESQGKSAKEIQERRVNINLFVTDDISKAQQMFKWANDNKNIDSATATIFDRENPFSDVSSRIIEICPILKQTIGKRSGSTKQNDEQLISIEENKEILKTVKFGPKQKTNSKKMLETWKPEEKRQEILRAVETFWNDFAPQAVHLIQEIKEGTYNKAQIAIVRQEEMSLEPGWLKIIAVLYHEWVKTDPDHSKLSTYLSQMETNKKNVNSESEIVSLGLYNPATKRFTNHRDAKVEAAVTKISTEARKL